MIETIKAKGVDTSHLRVEKGKTAVTQVELIDGERVFGDYDEGVLEKYKLTDEDIDYIKNFDVVICDDYKQRREEIEKEKERLEREANIRRIAEKIRKNNEKRENGEWDDDEYVQALRLFLIDEGEIEEDEDIYDVIFESDDYTYYNDGRII
jgi:hypothetical protein